MMKINTKTKILMLLCVSVILPLISGCSFNPEPHQENGSLLISVGLSRDLGQKTYLPSVDLNVFEKIVVRVSKGEQLFAETSMNPRYQNMIIELLDLPYDTYIITARAYISADHEEENYTAFGEIEFNFAYNSTLASITMDLLIGEEGTTGTLRYKLINAIGLPIIAELYPLDDIAEESKITLTQGLNPLDTVTGFYSMILNTGLYVFFFGENPPSVVHIYKNMETVIEEEFTIYGSLSTVIYPEGNSDVQILLSHSGETIHEGEILSYGTDVTITLIPGSKYRYKETTVLLNNGSDNVWFITPESKNPDSSYSRTFRMPSRDVVISVETEPIPYISVDFDLNDLSKHEKLRFWSMAGGNPSAIISSAAPGSTITVRAHQSFDPPAGEIQILVLFWYLDGIFQAGSMNSETFTIPPSSTANYVGAVVDIDGVPYSVNIPIKH